MTLSDELSLDHGTLTGEEGPRTCACGCGELLREGSTRAFIRGHKQRMVEEAGDDSPDPEPGEEAKNKPTVRVTAKMRKEMQDAISSYLAMGAGSWAMSDPICAEPIVKRADEIAEKLTPILARNPAFVRYFRSSSTFKEAMDLFLVLFPIGKTIAQHHLFRTVGWDENDQGGRHMAGGPINYNDYVA